MPLFLIINCQKQSGGKMVNKNASMPLAPVEKVIRQGSGSQRVSAQATETMTGLLVEIALKISARASELAKHAGRKTIKEADIKLAAKEFNF